MPSGLLGHLQVTGQLVAGDSLDVGGDHIPGNGPFSIREIGTLHNGSSLEGEKLLVEAIPATVSHGLVLDIALNIKRSAVRATRPVRPTLARKPLDGRLFIGKKLHDLNQRKGLSTPKFSYFLLYFHSVTSITDRCDYCISIPRLWLRQTRIGVIEIHQNSIPALPVSLMG